MSDKNIKCSCGKEFIFTEGEQDYFADRKLQTPKYCHDCREERRKKNAKAPIATGMFPIGYREREEAGMKKDREMLGE